MLTDYYCNVDELITQLDVVAILKEHGINGFLDDTTGSCFHDAFPNANLFWSADVFAWLGY